MSNTDLKVTESATLTLAGVDYQIKPFVLRQLKKILPLISFIYTEITTNGLSEVWFDKTMELVSIALAANGAAEVVATLEDQPITAKDLQQAVIVIAQQAGLIKSQPGESAGAVLPQ